MPYIELPQLRDAVVVAAAANDDLVNEVMYYGDTSGSQHTEAQYVFPASTLLEAAATAAVRCTTRPCRHIAGGTMQEICSTWDIHAPRYNNVAP